MMLMSVRLPICLERACIVIMWRTLVRIKIYGWIVQCSGHPDRKAFFVFFQFHLEERWGMDVEHGRRINK